MPIRSRQLGRPGTHPRSSRGEPRFPSRYTHGLFRPRRRRARCPGRCRPDLMRFVLGSRREDRMSHSHGSSTGRTLTPLVEHLHAPTELDHAKGRLKVLICAYACEPDRGSEEGAGWNWTVAAARDHDVWVLTREHDPGVQRAALAEEGVEATFEHVKLPRWLDSVRRWEHVYYSVWKVAAAVRARELHEENGFDLVHHLTWSNVWLPSPCAAVRVPFVHGPVGGGPCVPLALFPLLCANGALKELLP